MSCGSSSSEPACWVRAPRSIWRAPVRRSPSWMRRWRGGRRRPAPESSARGYRAWRIRRSTGCTPAVANITPTSLQGSQRRARPTWATGEPGRCWCPAMRRNWRGSSGWRVSAARPQWGQSPASANTRLENCFRRCGRGLAACTWPAARGWTAADSPRHCSGRRNSPAPRWCRTERIWLCGTTG
jgi:hypothetical protein